MRLMLHEDEMDSVIVAKGLYAVWIELKSRLAVLKQLFKNL